ncbi:S53 family peptidase [Dyella telluris]|uniref:S8/S53 family peptidase n=1 Tax=Dyella telluris TaxID=2763498 RepID=A0A7G8Q0C4_9GAMM|nr:S53 family peptidase [Dyella telluris]QNK00232.1 S8/S53 family peptidase [Dyella telluris]
MLSTLHRKSLAVSLGLLFFGGATSAAMAAGTSSPADLGASNTNQTVNVTLVLGLRNQDALENFVYSTVTQGNPSYHRFLTTAQFADRFGASTDDIAKVQAFVKQQGLQQVELLPNHLAIKVSGTIGQFNKAFQTSIHDYRNADGTTFHRPNATPTLPSSLSGTLVVASGLSTEARYRSRRVSAFQPSTPTASTTSAATMSPLAKSAAAAPAKAAGCTGNATATCTPGSFTVGDVANRYNINPLYAAGVNGRGVTIGIATLANFLPADAYTYWSTIGLNVKPNRISQVHVDGGGPLGSAAGSGETSLDVEQSGGVAPWANIIVYDAPNTDAGFFDVFNQAVSDNKVDSLSVSWGSPEIFYFPQLNGGVDLTDELRAFHQVFLEAAAQGISMFATAGDSGAYDTVRSLGGLPSDPVPPPLTADAPGSDPLITTAGGTTVPFTYSFSGGPKATLDKESIWGWDYIASYFQSNFGVDLLPEVYSVGGGGGVSVFWPLPRYQAFTSGIRRSEKKQTLLAPAYDINYTLPGNYKGRNVPDVSLNADPETGYSFVSSLDGPGLLTFEGGTSFVAPQLNGINALLTQATYGRVGLWNPQIYAMQNIFSYGPFSPFNDIRAGDNWFYKGVPGYEPGAGIGTLNVTNLALFFSVF